jgi:hypothetical protein
VEFLIEVVISKYLVAIYFWHPLWRWHHLQYDLRFFFRRQDLFLDVNSGVGRLEFSRYEPLDLCSSCRFWIFSHGCCDDICSCNVYPAYYVIDNGDSYSRLPTDVDRAVWLLFPSILVLVLLPMLIDFFNGYVRAPCLWHCSSN